MICPRSSMVLVYESLHDWVIYGVNVSKYASTMDDLGMGMGQNWVAQYLDSEY